MSTQKNLITLCIATVFTLGLAACGGGGGGGSSTVAMMDDDTPMDESLMEPTPTGITLDAMAVAGAIGPDAGPPTEVPGALMITNGVPGAMSPLEASDAVDAAAIDGWTSSVTQRMTEAIGGIVASTDTVIIYNDQAARSRPMFSVRYPETGGDTLPDDALRIVGGVDGVDNNVGLISGVEEFPSAALQTDLPFDANTNYAGMFDGAPGTFTCADADCTLTTDADGKLSGASANNWYFIASEGATVDVNDYLRFGFWLNESTDSDGDPSYDINVFYGGAMATPRVGEEGYQDDNLRGTASYSGAATGAYMRKTFNEDATVNPVAGGQFTATAALMANFAQIQSNGLNTIPDSLLRSISGNISNFMDGGEAIPGNWELELMRAPFDSTAVGADEDTFTGATSGGEGTVPGMWEGMFFGPVTTHADGTTVQENDAKYPTGVAGEFTGHFNTGHVIGAFGATVDDD